MEKNPNERPAKHLLLYGFPGVGKTTYGRLIAISNQLLWVDTDLLIQQKYSIPSYNFNKWVLNTKEANFRQIEYATLQQALSNQTKSVISLGGGTLLYQDSLELAKQHTLCYIPHTLINLKQRLQHHPFMKDFKTFYQDRIQHYYSLHYTHLITNTHDLKKHLN